ncbi:Panacea domain-containing protein [Paenibacillus sp. 481]|uniref:Panacea domain-containing protein n=1 Tax=Paenibacillus sp. 481 TaxID=2835869 RepID=UPI001E41AF86|nr:type II toxin-antitoxin system antitoxin SocA domain-containing protein [Paenibacillus sp. 481]
MNWFLSKEAMTPKKIQKILYYAYSWYLTLENEDIEQLDKKLFHERFEAWIHGPVIPKIYSMYRDKGYQIIEKFEGFLPHFDEDTEEILQQVWDEYGHYNGTELETISHQESPWIKAREGHQPLDRCTVTIEDKDMFECYIQRIH